MKSTDELLNSLCGSQSVDEYINQNSDSIITEKIPELLNQLLEAKGLKKSAVVTASEISGSYGYQIFSGDRKEPSRDKILAILIAMELSLDEVQIFLKSTGFSPLYPKLARDSIIIFCINNHKSVMNTNTELFNRNEQTL